MKDNSFLVRLLFLAALLVSMSTNAQVTIGSGNPPSPMSLLYLDASEQQKALHLPRLTEEQRDSLVNDFNSSSGIRNSAVGLMTYNVESRCLEFWNGSEWISLCVGEITDPCGGFSTMSAVFCSSPAPTIDSLNVRARAVGGRGNIRWYASAYGGVQLSGSHVLVGTQYYAENCAGMASRVPVLISLANCSPINSAAGRVTTFVNVMYDFQTQHLEAFTTSGGDATSWQWQVSSDNNTWHNITGATSSTFTIPADFMYDVASIGELSIEKGIGVQAPNLVEYNLRELYFRCLLTNPISSNVPTSVLGIYFIRTNTSGYGMDANGVRYLTLNRAQNLSTGPNTINVALLNLGASGTGAWLNGVHVPDTGTLDDAGDLGDFYQWGRVADGHQQTVWSKNPTTRVNQIIPMEGNGTTSLPVPRGAAPGVDSNGQIPASNTTLFGNFIVGSGDWGTGINDRWGNAFDNRTGSPASLADWTDIAQANNPCPPDWRVPSNFDMWDAYRGNGSNNPSIVSSPNNPHDPNHPDNQNAWRWRGTNINANAIGGVFIINNNGEALFVPAASMRVGGTGQLGSAAGTQGILWTSGPRGNNMAWLWDFGSTYITAGFGAGDGSRTHGLNVRCVQ